MDALTNSSAEERGFDVIVFGATGLTGRLVAEQLALKDKQNSRKPSKRRWAVAGRDVQKMERLLRELHLSDVDSIEADLDDISSLQRMALQTKVVVNCAGPYTAQAESMIAACVRTRTSYVDLSGEIPLLRRIINKYHDPAQRAGVQIVQMAGWEAMPADLTTLVASKRATAQMSNRESSEIGPGAAFPIQSVMVSIRYLRRPEGGVPATQAVSAGTLHSIVEILRDPEARLIGQTDALLPLKSLSTAEPKPVSLDLHARTVEGRVFGPVAPVAFLNPPIVYRTAALLAGGSERPFAVYREGTDLGSARDSTAGKLIRAARRKALLQRLLVGFTRTPLLFRKALGALLKRLLPPSGSGPSGRYLRDWEWEVRAIATTIQGHTGSATLRGMGHPGYLATAALIAEVALHSAHRHRNTGLSGCITPGLVIQSSDNPEISMPSLSLI